MPCPFPGMDPYLERPEMWPDVHERLIVVLANDLAPQVRPHYYVSVEQRVYLSEVEGGKFVGRPDVAIVGQAQAESKPEQAQSGASVLTVRVPVYEEVRETYLEVRARGTDSVISVIELLSPSNKRPGHGRQLYLDKRMEVLGTRTNLVEIDLLRAWEPMPVIGNGRTSDYRILVSRGRLTPDASLYVFGVRQPIPPFPLPLRPRDQEPVVELGRLLHELYDRAGYDLRLDYSEEPEPPLRPQDAAWADELLRQKGLR